MRRATPEDAAAIAGVHVASWQATYRGILPDGFLAALSVEERTKHWTRNLTEPDQAPAGISSAAASAQAGHASFVAVSPDRDIVGFCSAGPNRGGPRSFAGEIYAIYLIEGAQRQGFGRALFTEGGRWLESRGLEPFLVWVLADNTKARGFYAAIGGEELEQRLITIGAKSYPEVAYGFRGASR